MTGGGPRFGILLEYRNSKGSNQHLLCSQLAKVQTLDSPTIAPVPEAAKKRTNFFSSAIFLSKTTPDYLLREMATVEDNNPVGLIRLK